MCIIPLSTFPFIRKHCNVRMRCLSGLHFCSRHECLLFGIFYSPNEGYTARRESREANVKHLSKIHDRREKFMPYEGKIFPIGQNLSVCVTLFSLTTSSDINHSFVFSLDRILLKYYPTLAKFANMCGCRA